MTKIPLTQGLFAVVDDADAHLVAPHRWYAKPASNGGTCYAVREVDGIRVWMHHAICPPRAGLSVDHVNSNGLDNRRGNLRLGSPRQQCWNRRPMRGKRSAYKGVIWQKDRRLLNGGQWRARIVVAGKTYSRSARSETHAAILYNAFAEQHYGEFAWLNPIPEGAH